VGAVVRAVLDDAEGVDPEVGDVEGLGEADCVEETRGEGGGGKAGAVLLAGGEGFEGGAEELGAAPAVGEGCVAEKGGRRGGIGFDGVEVEC
jgi:hypothetical protein